MGFLSIMSSIPGNNQSEAGFFLFVPVVYNIMHIPAFGLLFILLYRYFSENNRKVFFYSFTITVGYGVVNEIYQFIIPDRYPSLMDIMLNIIGANLGFLVVRIVENYKK